MYTIYRLYDITYKYNKYIQQGGGEGRPEINKNILKEKFIPVKDWILKIKMNDKTYVTKEEFRKLFGQWLKQYNQLNQLNK